MFACALFIHTHTRVATALLLHKQIGMNERAAYTDSSVAAKVHTRNNTHRIDHMRNDNVNDGNERNKTEKSGENEKQRCDRNIRYT